MSAASVAVIYAYRQKTARADWKIFSIFLQSPMNAGCRLTNRMWKSGGVMMDGKGKGCAGKLCCRGKCFPGMPRISRVLFHACGNNSMAVTVLSPNLLDTQRRTS